MKKILILSDGRMGHVNQSIAFAKYLNYTYDIVEVKFKTKFFKVLSYLFDYMGIQSKGLFNLELNNTYEMVVGAGSGTYYATKVLAQEMHAKSITMMLPKGYRFDFDLIYMQHHDAVVPQKNMIELPANFAYVEPQGIYHKKKKKSIGIVIGGDNKVFHMSVENLKDQLDFIQTYYEEYEIAITTSPRTTATVERLVESYHFGYEVIFSKKPVNPIPDFLEQCETIFITGDSTSMISEAISYGKANVVVLPLNCKKDNKFTRFIHTLAQKDYVYIFDGTIKNKNKKIDFTYYIQQAIT
jgi:hypothetical protein